MDTEWLVSVCLLLFVIFILILTRKSKPEAETQDTTYDPTLAYCNYGGKQLECSEDDMDRCMQRLSKVLFEATPEPRKMTATTGTDAGSKERSPGTRDGAGREPVHSQASHPKVQDKTSQPAAVENIMDEIEQAVQETVDSELYMRRRQHQARSRGRREGQWSEVTVKPEADSFE